MKSFAMRFHTRINGLLLVALTGLAVVLATGCSKESPAPGAEPSRKEAFSSDPLYGSYRFGKTDLQIDIGVQPLALPEAPVGELLRRDLLLAKSLKSLGATLETHGFRKGAEINYFLERKDLEGGLAGDMPTLTAAANFDVTVVAMVKHGFSSIIAARPMMLRDLAGKRVATGFGSTAHFTLLSALESEKLSDRDLTLIDMSVTEMQKALENGSIDAFCAWEPTPSLALSAHPEFQTVHSGLNMSFLYFRSDFVRQYPELTRLITAAVIRGCRFMRDEASLRSTAQLTAKTATDFSSGGVPMIPETTVFITRRDLIEIPGAPQIDEKLLIPGGPLEKEFLFLKGTKKISPNASWGGMIDSFDLSMAKMILESERTYDLQNFDFAGIITGKTKETE